jgi:hypothetical protein
MRAPNTITVGRVERPKLSRDGRTMVVNIPITLKRSGGETINEAYLGRVLRLTLLAPSIIDAILSGRQRDDLELAELLKPFPIEWEKQGSLFLTNQWGALGSAHTRGPRARFAFRMLCKTPRPSRPCQRFCAPSLRDLCTRFAHKLSA